MYQSLSAYDVGQTFINIDNHIPRLVIFGGLSLICNFIYFGSGIYNGFKYKVSSMPIPCIFLFIPHDFIYILMYHKWFNIYHFWFCELFWVGLIFTNIEEFIFLYLALAYGRKDILPQVSQTSYVALTLLGLAGSLVAFVAVKSFLADDLWLFTFGWTVWFCLPFVIPMMLRRNSSAGQSRIMWLAYIGMAICYWIAVWPLDAVFRSPAWLSLGAMIVLWALVVLYYIRSIPVVPARNAMGLNQGSNARLPTG